MTHSKAKARMRSWTSTHLQAKLKKSCELFPQKSLAAMSMVCSLTATETTSENGELSKRNLYHAHNGNLLWVSLRALLKFKKGGIIKGKKKKGVEANVSKSKTSL
jgi:hypothetical protein